MVRRKDRLVFAGIDVSKDKLDVSWVGLDGGIQSFQVPNDEAGHRDLVARFASAKVYEVRVVFEATGPYSTQLARYLCGQPKRIKAMMVQPAAARQFARACMQRAKTDRVDADTLREFAQRMDFVPTVLPEAWVHTVRSLERHMIELIDRRAALKNQVHAAQAAGESHPALFRVIEEEQATLGRLIDELEREVMVELNKNALAARVSQRMMDLSGIKVRATTRLLPELLALPRHLSPREAVAYVGLDPMPKQSGKAGNHGSWHISKQGNARVRRALYLVALTAIRSLPPAKAVYERLRARGKLKKVAIVAVMRKLLTAIWVMLSRDEPFDAVKFYGPTSAIAA